MSLSLGMLLMVLLLGVQSSTPAPGLEIPPGLSTVIERAQEFRSSASSGDLLRALQFVLPEDRNLVLAAGQPIYRNPRVVGVDLTEDSSRVQVRLVVDMPALDGSSGGNRRWSATDLWVLQDGEWFFDAADYRDLWTPTSGGITANTPTEADLDVLRRDLDEQFELLEDNIDLGTLIKGDVHFIEVPFRYSGEELVRIASTLVTEFVDLDLGTTRAVGPEADHFILIVNTSQWDGEFSLPLPLTVESEDVSVTRLLRVQGNVFAPISIELASVDEAERVFEITILNNSKEQIEIAFMSVGDTDLEILALSEEITAEGQGFIRLGLLPDGIHADKLSIMLKNELHGKTMYDFPLQPLISR